MARHGRAYNIGCGCSKTSMSFSMLNQHFRLLAVPVVALVAVVAFAASAPGQSTSRTPWVTRTCRGPGPRRVQRQWSVPTNTRAARL